MDQMVGEGTRFHTAPTPFLAPRGRYVRRATTMSEAADSFKDIAVPEGSDRRELYKSPYRAIYTYKMSAQELDEKFREAITGDHQKGGWQIKNDERVKYVGKLEVSKEVSEDGDPSNKKKLDYKARPRSLRALAQSPPPCPRRLPRALRLPAGRQRCAGRHWGGRFQSAPPWRLPSPRSRHPGAAPARLVQQSPKLATAARAGEL